MKKQIQNLLLVHIAFIIAQEESFLLIQSKKQHWDLDQKPLKNITQGKDELDISPSGSGCTECCAYGSKSRSNNCGCGPKYRIPYSYWLKQPIDCQAVEISKKSPPVNCKPAYPSHEVLSQNFTLSQCSLVNSLPINNQWGTLEVRTGQCDIITPGQANPTAGTPDSTKAKNYTISYECKPKYYNVLNGATILISNANYFIKILGDIPTVISGTPNTVTTAPTYCYYACYNPTCPMPYSKPCTQRDYDSDSNCRYQSNRETCNDW